MGVWGILLSENILANLQTAWLPAIIILSLSPLTAAINHRRTETCQLQPAGYHNTLLKEAARKQANIHAWRRCFYRDGSASDPRLILSVSCVLYIQGRDQYVAPHVMVGVRTVVQWLWERYWGHCEDKCSPWRQWWYTWGNVLSGRQWIVFSILLEPHIIWSGAKNPSAGGFRSVYSC